MSKKIGSMVRPLWLLTLGALAAGLLGGCQTSPATKDAARNTLNAVNIAYMTAGLAIQTYAALKPCGDGASALCKDQNVVYELNRASAAVGVALQAATTALETSESDASTVQKSITIATQALAALLQILAQYGLK